MTNSVFDRLRPEFRGWWSVVLALLLLDAGVAGAGKLQVVTTLPELAAIARAVGGEEVEVESIAKGSQDPHYLEAKPSFMRLINRADLLVYNGLELEIGWLPLLLQGGRNPQVLPGSRGNLDASAGIRVLEVPTGEVDRSMGDVHPEGNPHYLTDPRNGLVVAGTIASRLQALAPDRAEVFARNLEQFREELRQRISGWEERAKGFKGQRVVAYHKQWEYLADWLGLGIADYIEEKPGIPPSPRHISSLVERMQREGIQLVLYANYQDAVAPERVAAQAGGRAVALPAAVGGEEGIETFTDMFELIVKRLEQGFAQGER